MADCDPGTPARPPAPPPRALRVGLVQWRSTPGEPSENLGMAIRLVHAAADQGADIVCLPELWASGYATSSLAEDVRAAAEPIPGPRSRHLADLARARRVWLFAGSVPELSAGRLFNTMLVLDRSGNLRHIHRKTRLYPTTGEDRIFAPGDTLSYLSEPELGRIGTMICFEGDFPESGRWMRRQGVSIVVQPNAYEYEAGRYWDLLYPASALVNALWLILPNQCGGPEGETLLGGSRIVSPDGTVLVEAPRASPGQLLPPSVIVRDLVEREEYEEARGFAGLLSSRAELVHSPEESS